MQPAAVEADSRFRVTGVSNRKTDADTTDLIGPVVAAEVLTAFNQLDGRR